MVPGGAVFRRNRKFRSRFPVPALPATPAATVPPADVLAAVFAPVPPPGTARDTGAIALLASAVPTGKARSVDASKSLA